MLLAAVSWSWSARARDTLRCGARLVSVGQSEGEVEARCGPPSFRDVETYALPRNRGYAADVEVWTYNFGPNRLLRLLRFRDGELAGIRSAGYGFSGKPQDHCQPQAITVGMSKYALLFHCGEPVQKSAANRLLPVFPNGPVQRLPDGVYAAIGGYPRQVYREHWTYNFGPDRFQREVTLDDGVVTDVEAGERGYAPH